jgi:hypothetical protein
MGNALKVDKSEQRATGYAAAGALAGPVAGIEMRPARVRIVGADAIFHVPVAGRRAITPAGVRRPDRGGAPALRIGRLVDDAALEHHHGPVFQLVLAGGRWRDQTQDQQQHHGQDFHGDKQTTPAGWRRDGCGRCGWSRRDQVPSLACPMLVLHWLILDRECKLRSPSRMRGPRLRARTGFPLPRERTGWVNAKQQWSSAGAA